MKADTLAGRIIALLTRLRLGLGRRACAAWRCCVCARECVLVLGTDEHTPVQELVETPEVVRPTLAELERLIRAATDRYLDEAYIEKARNYMDRGCDFFAVLKDGVLASAIWTEVRRDIVAFEVSPTCHLQLDRPVCYTFDAYTRREMRGLGLATHLWRAIVREARRMGYEVWAYCRHTNLPSSRSLQKAGLRLRYRMMQVRLFHCFFFGQVTTAEGECVSRRFVLGLAGSSGRPEAPRPGVRSRSANHGRHREDGGNE